MLLIWQVAIVDASEKTCITGKTASPDAKSAFSGADYRRADPPGARFLRELDPDVSDLHNLQQRYNDLFLPEDGVHWLH